MSKQNKKNDVPKENFLTVLTKIIFLVLFGLMILLFFSQTDTGFKLGLILFGLFFIFGGIMAMKDSILGIIFLLAGLGISLGTVFFGYGAKIFEINQDVLIEQFLPPVLVSIFIIVGLGFIFVPIISRKINENKHTIHIYGKVIDIKKKSYYKEGRRHTVYLPTYEYYYNSQIYKLESNIWSNIDVPNLGETIDMYINPDYPQDFYIKTGSKTNLFLLFFGLCFTIIGCMAEYFIFIIF